MPHPAKVLKNLINATSGKSLIHSYLNQIGGHVKITEMAASLFPAKDTSKAEEPSLQQPKARKKVASTKQAKKK